MKRGFLFTFWQLILFSVIFSQCSPRTNLLGDYEIVKKKSSQKGIVVTAHPLASKVGADILKIGGNAIDAAIAVQLALTVVYPEAGNIGGGGFAVYQPANGNAITLDFREKAPAAASKDMYLDKDGKPVPDLSVLGHLSVGVPGTIDGLFTMFEKYSKLKDFSLLIQPSIDLASRGFKITQREANNLNKSRDLFIKYNNYYIPFVKDSLWKVGDVLTQEELAKTLERIKNNGRKEFYEGKTARLMIECIHEKGGIINQNDLFNYSSKWRMPLKAKYKNYEIVTMPPPSSGGIALIQLLKILEANHIEQFGFHSPEAIHLMVEAERRVYADRATFLGDPDFYKVPVNRLIEESYLKQRMLDFDSLKATPSTLVSAGNISDDESHETTHFSIIDSKGNAVSITTTLNSGYGSKVVVKGAGFLLNNEMDDFSIKEGAPNQFGLVGGKANSIAPNKRMLSSMTPTIINKDDSVYCVLGSPGGSTIITTVFQVITNLINFKLDSEEAVQAGRFHSQWLPDEIQLEEELCNESMINSLKRFGHKITRVPLLGKVEAIVKNSEGGYTGVADKRGDDSVEIVK